MRRSLRIALILLIGACLGRVAVPAAHASEASALDRIAGTLEKLLDAVRDGARREKVECVCKCDRS
jgi:hypothetical protein